MLTTLRLVRADDALLDELSRMADVAAMTPADRMIAGLREAEQTAALPLAHFQELAQALARLARQDDERAAALGSIQIAAAQDAIVRNLVRTVIGRDKFLVVDVGAHDGWFIDRLLADPPPDVRVVAFEPLPDMQPLLAERAARWPSVRVFAQAVGERPGVFPLKVYPQIPGLSSLLEFESGYRYFGDQFDPTEVHTVEVPVVTLDDHFRDHPPPDGYEDLILKIDVQGYEDRVLQGARGLFEGGRVKAVLIELITRPKYHGTWDHLALLNFFAAHGFDLYDVNPFYREIDMAFQPAPVGRLTEMDCLFVHRSRLDPPATPAD